ncbi:putative SAM dependent carboxyl methyltransferase [Arabidopsis thaliana]
MIGGEGPERYNQQSLIQSIARSGEGQDDQGELSEPQPRFPFEPVRYSRLRFLRVDLTLLCQSKTYLVEEKYHRETDKTPTYVHIDFHVLFNDFSINDFNTLFQTLSLERRYYSAGVPGSFFDRVLPKESF